MIPYEEVQNNAMDTPQDAGFASNFYHDGENICLPPFFCLNVAERLEIYWSLDDQYYLGVVSSINEEGKHGIAYDDGDSDILNMSDGHWCLSDSINASLVCSHD